MARHRRHLRQCSFANWFQVLWVRNTFMINEIVIFLRIGKKTLCSIDVILMMGWI